MNLATTNRISGMIALSLGIAIWLYTGSFPELEDGHPGPALFPRLIALLFMFSGGLLFFIREKQQESAGSGKSMDWIRWGGLLLLYLLIPFLPQNNASILIGIGLAVFLTSLMLKTRLWVAGVTTAGTLLAIYWIFGILLGVPL